VQRLPAFECGLEQAAALARAVAERENLLPFVEEIFGAALALTGIRETRTRSGPAPMRNTGC
jgi:hypothetical protein